MLRVIFLVIRNFQCPSESDRKQFLESLIDDLQQAGHNVTMRRSSSGVISVRYEQRVFENNDKDTEFLKSVYRRLRNDKLDMQREVILEAERNGVLDLLIPGSTLDFNSISPRVEFCTSPEDNQIYSYYSMSQALPSSSGIGRKLRAVVYDVGQKQKTVMGIIGIASPGYTLKARDTFMGWNNHDSKREAKRIKDEGLRQLGQLAVCAAVPPYNFLNGAKLLALIALSSDIKTEYFTLYNSPLRALITTSAFGNHAAIYNRLNRNKLGHITNTNYGGDEGVPAGKKSEIYVRIGLTSNAAPFIIGQRTIALARKLTGDHNIRNKGKQALRKAITMCGLNYNILTLNQKGIYIGYLDSKDLQSLRDPFNTNFENSYLQISSILEYWKENHLRNTEEQVIKLRQFVPQMFALSSEITDTTEHLQ